MKNLGQMRYLMLMAALAVCMSGQTNGPDVQKLEYWTDPETNLTWAVTDNGSGVTQAEAQYYCRTLTLGGLKGWTLPDIEQLQHLFGGPADDNGHHVSGPIKLTGWAWSSTAGKAPGEAWVLDFGDGGRASVVTGDSGLNRALCVRHAQ